MDPQACVAIVFLALAVWREARGEGHEGKVGVACSILNRVDRPSWWGSTVLSVVTKKWQYSSLTDPHDPQLTTYPKDADPSWVECLQIARDAITGTVDNPVPTADSYHDISIPPPNWATREVFVKKVGRLIFYNVDRDVEAAA